VRPCDYRWERVPLERRPWSGPTCWYVEVSAVHSVEPVESHCSAWASKPSQIGLPSPRLRRTSWKQPSNSNWWLRSLTYRKWIKGFPTSNFLWTQGKRYGTLWRRNVHALFICAFQNARSKNNTGKYNVETAYVTTTIVHQRDPLPQPGVQLRVYGSPTSMFPL